MGPPHTRREHREAGSKQCWVAEDARCGFSQSGHAVVAMPMDSPRTLSLSIKRYEVERSSLHLGRTLTASVIKMQNMEWKPCRI